jgi:protein ImuA
MQAPNRHQRLATLRDVIADIERKPALAEARHRVDADATSTKFPRFAGGLVQEVFTDDTRHASVSLGFALAQTRALLSGRRMGILYVQLVNQGQEMGLPYGPGLVSFGIDPADIVMVRVANLTELLWACEEALNCKAIAAVVADVAKPSKHLDFTASRRLSLRAAQSGASLFLLRYGKTREASAAQLRWHLTPTASGRKPFDDHAPGPARWTVKLERGSLIKQHAEWVLGWTENGFTSFTPRRGPKDRIRTGTPLPRPLSAKLANRLSQAS